MSHIPDHGTASTDMHGNEGCGLPCVDALLASTLALMTGHAQACCADHRVLMAQKTTANLSLLAAHPTLSEGFRSVLQTLHDRWMVEAGALQPATISSAQPRALWHTTPEVIQ